MEVVEEVFARLGVEDEEMVRIRMALTRYVPQFQEHVEGKLEEWFGGILKQMNKQVHEALHQKGVTREKKLSTTLPEDLFGVMAKQIDIVAGRLRGEHLFEVLKATLEHAVGLVTDLVSNAPDWRAEGGDMAFQKMCILMNDFANTVNEFEGFKSECLAKFDERIHERAESVFDDYFRSKLLNTLALR